ncbi:MAG: hypothetical protein VX436_00110, partial [Planctomycetota bacterium]|nr:hypothetical protein [Planctomycetota bacterium]
MNSKNSIRSLLLIGSVAIASWCTATATAQMEYMAEAMRPEYMARDLVVFAEGLNLDDTQEVIVEAMFDTYEDDFQNGWATTQDRLNRIADEIKANPPTSSKETLEPVLNALGDWLEEKRALDEGLLDNVRAILVEEQRQLWQGFNQRLYREKHTSRGRLSGEAVDLFQIVRDTDLSQVAENAISENLDEYALAMDIAIRNRDKILRGNPKKLFDNILSGNTKQDDSVIDELIKARVEVRDLNDRYIEILSSGLAGEDSENFRLRSLKRGYPRIYRRTPAQRIFRQAAENEDYAEDLIVQIIQLEVSYLQELLTLNHELLLMTRKHEPEVHRHRQLAGQVRRDGGTPEKLEDPTRDIYKSREELGKRYIDMLRSLLSPEEFLELDGSRRWIPRSEQGPLVPINAVPNASAKEGKEGRDIKQEKRNAKERDALHSIDP